MGASRTINERFKDPAKGSAEFTTGIPIDGSADPTGEYPRRNNWYGNSISQAGRGVRVNNVWLSGSAIGVNFDVPITNPSIFPFNQANETPSGHSFEIDDTPGNERILIKHHSGAGIEIKPDGSVLLSSISNQVQVVGGTQNIVVQGPGNLVYDGDVNMTVNGNYNLHVGGTFNVDVGANHNHSVHGTQITEVGDVHQTIVRGNKDVKVYGDTNEINIGNRKLIAKKDIDMLSRDLITHSNRRQNHTAVDYITSSSGKGTTISSEKTIITGRYGKVGGENFHHIGSLFTGPSSDNPKDPLNDQGKKTVFHGNLIGRALESWTSKYSLYSREAHSAHISNFAKIAEWSDESGHAICADGADNALWANEAGYAFISEWSVHATQAENASKALLAKTQTVAAQVDYNPLLAQQPEYEDAEIDCAFDEEYPNWVNPDIYDGSGNSIAHAIKPDYKFKWGWDVENFTAYEQQTLFLTDPDNPDAMQGHDGPQKVSPFYGSSARWWEIWNKTSPFAVRKVVIDYDDTLRDKISKIDGYTYYFRWSPSTDEVRSKLRTMDGANDPATSPEMQTDGKKCIQTLLDENRISPKYKDAGPSAPYEVNRVGKAKPYDGSRFGTTLLGNPVERASKIVTPKNRQASARVHCADPVYNVDRYDTPIVSSTRLSRGSTVGKFLGAPGSRASMEMIPLQKDRLDLARNWYLHAWLMEGVNQSREFQNYRLQVLEGYYHPAKGIREEGQSAKEYWREPFKKEDGTNAQRSIVRGGYEINELKHQGRAVVYQVLNSRGKVDYGAGFEMALYIRDTFFYDQLSLDYDMTRPDFVMQQSLIVVMPKCEKDYRLNFEMKYCTYFNRNNIGGDLIEITDKPYK